MRHSYVRPKDVRAPQDRWKLDSVLYDGGPGQAAVAFGLWDKQDAVVARWNGEDAESSTLGNPQSSGHATWFVLPGWLVPGALRALLGQHAAGDVGVQRPALDRALTRFKVA